MSRAYAGRKRQFWIFGDERRRPAHAAGDAVARDCPPSDRGKTLLFAARDDHADILVEELRTALAEEYGPQPHDLVEKITGSVDTDMRPVVVDPALSFTTLVGDLERAATDEDRAFVRDQIIVKLRQRIGRLDDARREALEAVLGPLADLPDRLKSAPASETLELFRAHPSLAAALDAADPARKRDGVYVSEHEDELISVEDDFGGKASPTDYIESFEAFVRSNMNAAPAMVAAVQRPRELTRKELKDLAVLLDENGFSEASLRQAYGRARNADIAAHIIGFVRQAALGDPLVPYERRTTTTSPAPSGSTTCARARQLMARPIR